MTYTHFRAKLASTMVRVCDNKDSLIITRCSDQAVVMLSLEEYKAFEETACLLPTPANTKRLLWAPIALSTLVLCKIQAIALG